MKLRHLTISTLALILMTGCGDDAVTGVNADLIAGTWTATKMVFTADADPNDFVDIIADEGAALEIVFDADGTYDFTFTFPGFPDENETGTYSVSGSTMTITPAGEAAETFTISRDGDTMTLTDADDFDFGAGDEAATVVITLTRPA